MSYYVIVIRPFPKNLPIIACFQSSGESTLSPGETTPDEQDIERNECKTTRPLDNSRLNYFKKSFRTARPASDSAVDKRRKNNVFDRLPTDHQIAASIALDTIQLFVLLEIFNTKRVFRQQIKARFIKQKSVILSAIIHGHAFMPAPQLTASTAAGNHAHG